MEHKHKHLLSFTHNEVIDGKKVRGIQSSIQLLVKRLNNQNEVIKNYRYEKKSVQFVVKSLPKQVVKAFCQAKC